MNSIFGSEDEGSTEENKTGNAPVLKNGSEGTAAWLNTDQKGDVYVSISLPLGLGRLNLFPVTDEMRDALNQLHQHLQG